MNGLILKDMLNLKKQLKFYLLFIFAYAFIAIASKNSSIFGGIVCVLAAMLPITALAFDERSNFTKYALTMAVSRKDIVLSKYIIGVIFSLIGALLNLIFNIIINGFSTESIVIPIIMFSLSIIFLSLTLPFLFKFGVEKGRMFMMIILFVPAILIMIFAPILANNPPSDMEFIKSILNIIPFILLLISIIILIASSIISINIFKNKDL